MPGGLPEPEEEDEEDPERGPRTHRDVLREEVQALHLEGILALFLVDGKEHELGRLLGMDELLGGDEDDGSLVVDGVSVDLMAFLW
jgi:hypothetical protein